MRWKSTSSRRILAAMLSDICTYLRRSPSGMAFHCSRQHQHHKRIVQKDVRSN